MKLSGVRNVNKFFIVLYSCTTSPVNIVYVDCYSYGAADKCEQSNGTFFLRNCYNSSEAFEKNLTAAALLAVKKTPPAEEYFTLVKS